MSKTYVIQWKSKINGRAGRGTKHLSLQEAENLVYELNREYPNIHHELLDSQSTGLEQPESPAEPLQAPIVTPTEDTPESAPDETHAFSE